MPVEIRELVIRASVEPAPGAPDSGGCGAVKKKPAGEAGKPSGGGGGNDDLVQECVREVMRILESRRER
jgi:hypothetical protein